MKTHPVLLSVCSIGLLTSMAAGAEAAECVTHPTLGVEIPTTHPGICVLGNNAPVGISQLTEEGLLFLVSESPIVDFNPPQGRGTLSLTVPDAKIIFCPGDPGELVAAAGLQNCLDNGTTFDAGQGAFAGRGEMLVSTGLTVTGETECPASVHARGMVRSPTGGDFEIAVSLALFPSGIDGRCESVDRTVALSYLPPQGDFAGLASGSRQDTSAVPAAQARSDAEPTKTHRREDFDDGDEPSDDDDDDDHGGGGGLGSGGGDDDDDGQGRILAELAAIRGQLARVEEELDGPSTSATFCISQDRALELGVDWAAELKGEIEAGAGWPIAFKGKVTASPSLPLVFLPPVSPVPVVIPTEAKIGFAGGLGRGLEICIDLPVELSDDDKALLEEVAMDINEKTGDGVGQKGKFQRRAHRILNYAALRVQGGDALFDRADTAADSLLDKGLFKDVEPSEGLDVFREKNIQELLATLEIPVEVSNLMANPGQVFDGLPDLANGVDELTCAKLGVSDDMRMGRPGLDSLCNQLEDLPDFGGEDGLKTGLAAIVDIHGIVVGIAAALGNVSPEVPTEESSCRLGSLATKRSCDKGCRENFGPLDPGRQDCLDDCAEAHFQRKCDECESKDPLCKL